jgi:hypothetical protein
MMPRRSFARCWLTAVGEAGQFGVQPDGRSSTSYRLIV